jgi:predicted ATPase
MLTHVHIENFRCLHAVDAALAPLTVLIGQNDTGKSAFLEALRLPFDSGTDFQVPALDHWNGNSTMPVSISVKTASGGAISIERLHRTNPLHYKRPPNAGVRVRLFRLPETGPAMQSPGAREHDGVPELGETAEWLPALLDYMLRRERKRLLGLERSARERIPGLEELNIATPDPNTRRVDLRLASGLELPAASASVGVKLIIFFLALCHHPNPPDVLLLEEPENGVHPARLADIMKLLRSITKGENCGHPAQIILTTHSPYLLDHVNLDEDQVLVFRRNDDGSRTCEPVDRDRLKAFLDDFMLGEVWFNEQEAGLVKQGGG